jgi:hypothetical protein
LAANAAVALTTIDTITGWDGTSTVSSFGIANTATYGQVVTAPPGETSLTSFSFEMNLPSTVAFRGEVYAWDSVNGRATGPSLYESAPTQTAGAGFQIVTFNMAVPVTPGQQYVIFASNSKDQAGHSGAGSWGQVGGSPYAGGGFVFINNGPDPTQWTTGAWTENFLGAGGDLAFRAVFGGVAVPTPTLSEYMMLLMAVLLAITGFVVIRRRRN